ncbi:Protein FMP42 [Leucoagaricus sp. SymC.cos]|nr:Protein FMP42 [Leucoagaricus sp. SymC.cos]
MASTATAADPLVKVVTPIAVAQVSAARRILQILSAVIYCLLSAGIVFGYAALKPVLVEEGIYRDKCTPAEIEEGVQVCHQQEIKLNMMFTVAAVATNMCAMVVGIVLDRYGPRFTGFIGSILLALGCFGFGVSSKVTIFDPYPASYLFLATAGPFIFIPSMNLANTFPRHSGLILSLITGAFDSSPAIFLVYRLLYQSSFGPISLRSWFVAYLVVPVFIFFAQLFVMPSESYTIASVESVDRVMNQDERVRSPSSVSEAETLLGESPLADEVEERNKGVYGAMHGRDVKDQLRSFWFWGIAGFTIIQMLRINYFVATVRAQYEFLLHSYEASVAINSFFDVALPLGGLIAIPFIGTYLDTFSLLTIISTLVVCTTSMGLLGLVQDSFTAAYLNVIIIVVYRPFYYTVVSDYCAKVFGVATFGKVYGVVICLSGMLNLLQAILDMITFKWCNGDPRPVNTMLLVFGLVTGAALVTFVKAKGDQARCEGKKLLVDRTGRPGYGAI